MIGWYRFLKPHFQIAAVVVYTGWLLAALIDPNVNQLTYWFLLPDY